MLYTWGFCLRPHFWLLLLENILKSMGHSCSFSVHMGKLRPRGQDLPKVTQQAGTESRLEWGPAFLSGRGVLPHSRGPVSSEQTGPLGASRLWSLGTLRVFGLALRPLCHETVFPAWVGVGEAWGDLDWGTKLCERGRWDIWRGFLPPPAAFPHFPGTPSKQ